MKAKMSLLFSIILFALTTSLQAQTLAKFEIVPLNAISSNNSSSFGILLIDRDKNKLLACNAATANKKITYCHCDELKAYKGDISNSIFDAKSLQSSNPGLSELGFWSVDQTNGKVTFCSVTLGCQEAIFNK